MNTQKMTYNDQFFQLLVCLILNLISCVTVLKHSLVQVCDSCTPISELYCLSPIRKTRNI